MSRASTHRIAAAGGFDKTVAVVRRILNDSIYQDGRHFVDSEVANERVEQKRIAIQNPIPEGIAAANAKVRKATTGRTDKVRTVEFLAQDRLFAGKSQKRMRARAKDSGSSPSYLHVTPRECDDNCGGLSIDAATFDALCAQQLRWLETNPHALREACERSRVKRENEIQCLRVMADKAKVTQQLEEVSAQRLEILAEIAKSQRVLELSGEDVPPEYTIKKWLELGGADIDLEVRRITDHLEALDNPVIVPIHLSPVVAFSEPEVSSAYVEVMTDKRPDDVMLAILRQEVFNVSVSIIKVDVVDNGPADRYCSVEMHGSVRPLRDTVTSDVKPSQAAGSVLREFIHSGRACLEARPQWMNEIDVESTLDGTAEAADGYYVRTVPDWIHSFKIPFGEGVTWGRGRRKAKKKSAPAEQEGASTEACVNGAADPHTAAVSGPGDREGDPDIESSTRDGGEVNPGNQGAKERSSAKSVTARRRKISCEDLMDHLFEVE